MRHNIVLSSEDRDRILAWLSEQEWVDLEGRKVVPAVEPEEHLLGLIESWSEVVSEIERGYEFTIYDYIADIMNRDSINEVMQLLTEVGKKEFAKLVDPIDRRFLRATREVPIPLSHPDEPRERWWWYRIPKRFGEDLASHLHKMGLM